MIVLGIIILAVVGLLYWLSGEGESYGGNNRYYYRHSNEVRRNEHPKI